MTKLELNEKLAKLYGLEPIFTMMKSAEISSCKKFRYRLTRRWGEGKALVFIMLNPSTADETVDDPTIRRCIGFAKSNGFNAIDVVNLFAFRATNPSDLKKAGYLIGELNDSHIKEAALQGAKIVYAWGDNARGLARPIVVDALIRSLNIHPYVLKLTTKNIPSHPLMLRADCQLQKLEKS